MVKLSEISANPSSDGKGEKSKKRNWACVIYPESMPGNWNEILEKTGLQIAVSPLHDKDLEADEKTQKKPHYHVILCFPGPTTFNVVKKITDSLNAPIPISLEAVRGYYRYLTHKDNPEKAQYDEKDIKHLNGFSIIPFLSGEDISDMKRQIRKIIREKDILEYSDLMDYFDDMNEPSLAKIADTHTIFFNAYITSRRHKRKNPPPNNPPQTATDVMNLAANAIDDTIF